MESLKRLAQRWKTEGTHPVAIPSADEVRRTFVGVGSRATSDVLAMYELTGGMGNMDSCHFRLWPLADIKCEGESTSGAGVMFADYLIDCWGWRLKPVDEHRSAVYLEASQDSGPLLLSESLEAFFDAYLADEDFLSFFPA